MMKMMMRKEDTKRERSGRVGGQRERSQKGKLNRNREIPTDFCNSIHLPEIVPQKYLRIMIIGLYAFHINDQCYIEPGDMGQCNI